MKCRLVERALAANPAPAAIPDDLRQHAAVCSDCSAELQTVRRLMIALDALQAETPRIGADPRLEARVRAEFVRRRDAPAGTQPSAARRLPLVRASAVAAALLLAGSGAWLAERAPSTAHPRPSTGVRAASHQANATGPSRRFIAGGALASAGQPATAIPARTVDPGRARVARRGSDPAADADAAFDVDGELVALVDGPTEDVSHVVRVAVPRSALFDFGMGAVDGVEQDTVAADVLVADDGAPRAVRVMEPVSNDGPDDAGVQ